jgi:UDP-N-acetylmuramate: L-alanyl-gamma-D-glutamyl-meso-diaminopimelate ligase
VALLARELGHDVSGCDANVYPPMSTQLEAQGIALREGYDPAFLDPAPEVVVIGNALTRGNPLVEAVLERGLPYTSGAQWVAEHVLPGRDVIAVAGTHGKTTTTSLLAWILECAGLKPGFLVGGVPENFGVSARIGDVQGRTSVAGDRKSVAAAASPFVIEADEYDTAFFDKRSKFVHYRPRVAILNNLEYDHADIFPDLAAIQRQFHHLVRTVPGGGRLVVNGHDAALTEVLAMGCWTPRAWFGEAEIGTSPPLGPRLDPAGEAATAPSLARGPRLDPAGEAAGDTWTAAPLNDEVSRFRVFHRGAEIGVAEWDLLGRHNMLNALAALAAAAAVGVAPATALAALKGFRNVKRRLEVRGRAADITVYDDFAHHPTAIAATLAALRARVGNARIVAVLEPRSNTMRLGVHRDTLGPALALADRVHLLKPPDLTWNIERITRGLDGRGQIHPSVETILDTLETELKAGDHVLVMSNGGFGGIHARLLERLQRRARA